MHFFISNAAIWTRSRRPSANGDIDLIMQLTPNASFVCIGCARYFDSKLLSEFEGILILFLLLKVISKERPMIRESEIEVNLDISRSVRGPRFAD